MADVNQQRILQLAQQGNLQAIAVILNRPLIPKGAHVKIRANAECLQVLLEGPNTISKDDLFSVLEQQIFHLQLSTFSKVKVYAPKPGTSKASLIHAFQITPSLLTQQTSGAGPTGTAASPIGTQSQPAKLTAKVAAEHPPISRRTDPDPPPVAPLFPTIAPTYPSEVSQPSAPSLANTAPAQPGQRYSVAAFLAQVKTLGDLNVLKSHPFITGHCPQCGAVYPHSGTLPTYWDCQDCGWTDDLSEIAALENPVPVPPQNPVHGNKLLGSYLVEAGLLTEAQIQVALADQKMTGMRLGEALVRRGWIKEETIEYLMQKVILPERQSTNGSHAADLELSRSLIQALVGAVPPSVSVPTDRCRIPTPTPITAEQVRAKIHAEPAEQPAPVAEVPAVKASSSVSSERATLVLPDLDLSEHLEDDTPLPLKH